MIEDPSAAFESAQESDARVDPALSEAAEVYQSARFVDSPERASSSEPVDDSGQHAEPSPVEPAAVESANGQSAAAGQPDAIDALRAATTAADARTSQISPDRVAEIWRLHEVALESERRARRVLAKPGARRKLHDALADEALALGMHDFESFDEFAAVYSSTPVDDLQTNAAETIARINMMLLEIGIDPGSDPLEAARIFLSTHEAVESPPEPAPVPLGQSVEESVEESDKASVQESVEAPVAAGEPDVRTGAEVESAVEIEVELDPEPDAPWVPAAQLPAPPPSESPAAAEPGRDDDIVDRWIHAEARAERMHAEVDRAQAELVALLARSADLEQTVVVRGDERDNAHAELEAARERVVELERSIARSDTERDEIERSLATSRDRITELEGILADRESASAQAARDRATALDTVADLEANLAARTLELEQARTTVAELESELTTQVTHLDHTRGELGSARADVNELRTELETTRRSLDALDEHAEAIEAELAEARRKADSPETRRELEGVRQELTAARTELGELEARRTETETTLAHDQDELRQLRHELTTTRDATENVRSELGAARSAFEATSAQVNAAERAREAITIDAADLLARAEAEAAGLIERAGRDAEAIRQEAFLSSGSSQVTDADAIPRLVEQVAKLERKLAKQRRRLDRIVQGQGVPAAPAAAGPAATRQTAVPVPSSTAADILASAEREAIEIRRAARRDRERFRDELVGLLNRLAPLEDDDEDDDD